MKKKSGILYLLCHGTRREYAERLLYQGILHFSSPKRWIDEAKKGNEGQGDLLEGVYTNILNAKTEKEREQVEIVTYKGMSCYRSKEVVSKWGDQIRVTTPQVMSAVGQMQDWGMKMLRLFMSAAYHTGCCMMDGREVSNMFFWGEVQTMLYRKYHIQVRQGLFNDGMDDHFDWYFLGDDYDTILKNEQKDIFYYTRKTDYKGPVLSTLFGGFPPGKVVIKMYVVKKKVGKKT